MAKVVLYGILFLQILIRQGLGDESVYGETTPVNQNEYNNVHPIYNTPVSPIESPNTQTTATFIQNEEDVNKMMESEEQPTETIVELDADEQIKKIQQASETISSVIQSEFDNLAKMIQNPEKRSKRETTSLPTTKYLAKFLNYIRAHNDQQNDIINRIMSGEEIAEKFGIEYTSTPAIESNQVESDLDVQATENAEQTIEMPVEQTANPTLETTAQPNIVYPETTPVPYTTDENYFYYDTSVDTTPAPLESFEDTTEQPQIYDKDHIQDAASDRPSPFIQTAYDYTTPAYPEQNMRPYVLPVQEQIYYMMQPQEPAVFTDEVENILETDFSTEKGEEPRVSHQTYSTTHRMSQMPVTAYYHAMPQQMQYYFSLV